MRTRIVLSLLSALGLATALLAAATPQGSTLNEHELEGCDVVINPIGQRQPPITVMFEDEPQDLGNLIARFQVNSMKSDVASLADLVANPVNPLEPLEAGRDYRLDLTYDSGAKAVDVELFEGGVSSAKWDNTPVRGTFDRLGPQKEAYSEYVRHPTDSTKQALRVWFDNLGLQGGFLIVPTLQP